MPFVPEPMPSMAGFRVGAAQLPALMSMMQVVPSSAEGRIGFPFGSVQAASAQRLSCQRRGPYYPTNPATEGSNLHRIYATKYAQQDPPSFLRNLNIGTRQKRQHRLCEASTATGAPSGRQEYEKRVRTVPPTPAQQTSRGLPSNNISWITSPSSAKTWVASIEEYLDAEYKPSSTSALSKKEKQKKLLDILTTMNGTIRRLESSEQGRLVSNLQEAGP